MAVAAVLDVPKDKVKALVFQARTTLAADREARDASCSHIREQLATATGGELRRGLLRRHLRECDPCRTFRADVAQQRKVMAAVFPVLPSAGLKAAALGSIIGGGAAAGTGGAGTSLSAGVLSVLGAKTAASKGLVLAAIAGTSTAGGVAAVDVLRAQEAGTQPIWHPDSSPQSAPLTSLPLTPNASRDASGKWSLRSAGGAQPGSSAGTGSGFTGLPTAQRVMHGGNSFSSEAAKMLTSGSSGAAFKPIVNALPQAPVSIPQPAAPAAPVAGAPTTTDSPSSGRPAHSWNHDNGVSGSKSVSSTSGGSSVHMNGGKVNDGAAGVQAYLGKGRDGQRPAQVESAPAGQSDNPVVTADPAGSAGSADSGGSGIQAPARSRPARPAQPAAVSADQPPAGEPGSAPGGRARCRSRRSRSLISGTPRRGRPGPSRRPPPPAVLGGPQPVSGGGLTRTRNASPSRTRPMPAPAIMSRSSPVKGRRSVDFGALETCALGS